MSFSRLCCTAFYATGISCYASVTCFSVKADELRRMYCQPSRMIRFSSNLRSEVP